MGVASWIVLAVSITPGIYLALAAWRKERRRRAAAHQQEIDEVRALIAKWTANRVAPSASRLPHPPGPAPTVKPFRITEEP